MKKYRNIYVAATRQHVGKTTSTLGLVSLYGKKNLDVGYCKPVGQKYLDLKSFRVDKDTVLFADLLNFDIVPEYHSPVILGRGATKLYLDDPSQFDIDNMLANAKNYLDEKHEVVIYEGTGHPGVGSIANISNARAAKLLDAGVVMVVPGGIGNTIDMLNMCTALFREEEVPIIGVIVNKVWTDKMDEVRKYVGKWLEQYDIPLLGIIPYDKSLAYPLVQTVADSIKGTVTHYPENLNNKVENILAGSLVDMKELKSFQNLLLVASTRTVDRAIQKVKSFSNLKDIDHSPLSGIVVTGDFEISQETIDYVNEHKLPLITTMFDTYGVTLKISRIEVKINRNTPWKVQRAIELISENVDIDMILERSRL